MVNEALCSENCLGRWIWKSGEMLHSAQIPWEVQAINTCPDNFLWEKNKSALILVAPGLYQLVFGFYSKKHPVVRIFVNGEVIFSVCNVEGKTVTSPYKEKENLSISQNQSQIGAVGRHSCGNITGLTLNEFVALPARARITVCYEGESTGEGFICLRKL